MKRTVSQFPLACLNLPDSLAIPQLAIVRSSHALVT